MCADVSIWFVRPGGGLVMGLYSVYSKFAKIPIFRILEHGVCALSVSNEALDEICNVINISVEKFGYEYRDAVT